MPLMPRESAPRFELPGASFTTLSSPSRGAAENAVWQVVVAPGTPGRPHRITREETFVALRGRALATIDGTVHALEGGSALVVPAGALLSLSNPGPDDFEAIAVFPVGGRVVLDQDAPFVPPWAA